MHKGKRLSSKNATYASPAIVARSVNRRNDCETSDVEYMARLAMHNDMCRRTKYCLPFSPFSQKKP